MRAEFAEAVHFCTMAPFHLPNPDPQQVDRLKESAAKAVEKALVLYVRGVQLLNDFVDRYL